MNTLQDIRMELSTREPEIVNAFNLATDREPWNGLPEQERINYLRNLIQPFSELALSDRGDARLCRRALHIAARHGERRHDQGLPDAVLFQDLHYFRAAVCSQIGYDRYSAIYPEAITRIDRLLSLATSASLRGYYRDEFERRGRWPDVLDEIARATQPRVAPAGRMGLKVMPRQAAVGGVTGATEAVEQAARLARTYAADGRRWLDDLRRGAAGPLATGDRLMIAMLAEVDGAFDLLDVVGEEVSGPSMQAPVEGPRKSELVTIIRRDGTIEFASGPVVRSLGYEVGQLRGLNLIALAHPEDRDKLRGLLALDEVSATSDAPGVFRVRQRGGSWRALRMRVRPLLSGTDFRRYIVRGEVLDERGGGEN